LSPLLAHSRDGTRLAWQEAGSGAPLLLLAPALGTRLHWEPVVAPLAGAARVISWDYRGHGDSDAPGDPAAYSLERVIEDLAAVHWAAACAAPAWLAGLSLGGLVALCYALAHPERVLGLVLANSGPGFKRAESRERWKQTWERAAARLEEVGIEAYLEGERAREEVLGTRPDSPLARRAREGLARSDPRALARFARGVTANQPDLTGRLGEIRAPALVLCGAQDLAFHPAGELLAARLPRARHRLVAGAGHPLPLDAPGELAWEMRAFLAEASSL
jgi:2-succinyl-6-hydroxy-2,4-cyclohexadiene-1-carboxylate synthase